MCGKLFLIHAGIILGNSHSIKLFHYLCQASYLITQSQFIEIFVLKSSRLSLFFHFKDSLNPKINYLSFMDSQNDECVGSNSGQDNEEEQIYQHSVEQVIEKLEEVFNQMPNPGNHVIEELSEELGLDATQVTLISNMVNHLKEDPEKYFESEVDNRELEIENEMIIRKNKLLKERMMNRICPTCNIKKLREQNALLKMELEMWSRIVQIEKEKHEKK
ncbi:hypothetical protein RND71_009214 [Anisodus tanguticus]|uniref:Homeobox domain-containing protein n=1 Tax=Anisodus tanguticus TaxID=243964 RepID=A0AAE1SHL5_9SOLA|nr:hypothetical protein RND71_009214 [Anisodus tanguticus]